MLQCIKLRKGLNLTPFFWAKNSLFAPNLQRSHRVTHPSQAEHVII